MAPAAGDPPQDHGLFRTIGLVEHDGGDQRADRLVWIPSQVGRGRELTTRLNRHLERLEDDIRTRLRRPEIKSFEAVMAAVEDVTRIRVRER